MLTLPLLVACARLAGPLATPLRFPVDHGFHPEAQTEWWYLQGRLADEDGRPYSVFLSSVLHDPRADRVLGLPVAAWGRRVALLTACLADLSVGEPLANRSRAVVVPGPGARIASHESAGGAFVLRAGEWRTSGDGQAFSWDVPLRRGRLALEVAPTGPPLPVTAALHGPDPPGRLHVGTAAFSYYALTRARLDGWLDLGDGPLRVRGEGWLDHQWGFVYGAEWAGWSWYAITLDDGTDLLVSRIEARAGGVAPALVGTVRRPGGVPEPSGPVGLRVLEERGGYPVSVALSLPAAGMELQVDAALPEAEWRMVPVPIWEGPVEVRGRDGGAPVTGRGFAEHLRQGDPVARRVFASGDPGAR